MSYISWSALHNRTDAMLFPTPNRRFFHLNEDLELALRCFSALLAVTLIGMVGFMLIEDWGPWKSLFFTVITITTVGYGDKGLSSDGEVFAMFVLLLGIGTATYSLSSLVKIAISYHASWKRRMQSQINRLQDHFIICGHGRIGQTVAEQLQEAALPFVVIDHAEGCVQEAIERDFLVIQGNSTEDDVLIQAGIERARGIICVTDSDAENVFVTLSARELNPSLIIAARASSHATASKMRRAGAAVVVSPYVSAGNQITDAILRPKLADFLLRNRRGEIELSELVIRESSPFIGRTVSDVGREFSNVVFVNANDRDGGEPCRPGGDRVFAPGDVFVIAGRCTELEQIHSAAEPADPHGKSVELTGAS